MKRAMQITGIILIGLAIVATFAACAAGVYGIWFATQKWFGLNVYSTWMLTAFPTGILGALALTFADGMVDGGKR
jgi:uncharacterized membrane protein